MNDTATTTRLCARDESRSCGFDGFEFCSSCHQGMGCGFTRPRKCQLPKRRESNADLESRAISWQPVETAPRDGTAVLLWATRHSMLMPHSEMIVGAYRGGWWSGPSTLSHVTHWMQLPSDPAAITRESDAVLEKLAISLMTDDQAMASFIRWRTEFPDTTELPLLKAELGVAEYVDAIFAGVPE